MSFSKRREFVFIYCQGCKPNGNPLEENHHDGMKILSRRLYLTSG